MQHATPLRYPGGKAKMWPYVADLIRRNGCMDGNYAEPYAGGAGIAMMLLRHEYVRHVYLNDLNLGVYNFWSSILKDTDDFCDMLRSCKLTIKEWKRQRDIYRNPKAYSRLEHGFSMFYLNRTNRSGIINGGVIGGLDQTGEWKLDARFNREQLAERIEAIAQYKDRIHFSRMDAMKFLKNKVVPLANSTLVYLDPPYYDKGHRLYDNFYEHDDHATLATFLATSMKDKKWVVSYDNVANISRLYKPFNKHPYGLNYSAHDYRVGSELIIFGPGVDYKKPEGVLTRTAA